MEFIEFNDTLEHHHPDMYNQIQHNLMTKGNIIEVTEVFGMLLKFHRYVTCNRTDHLHSGEIHI